MSFFVANLAHASPNSITFQSRIVKPNGTALEAATVNFRFSITDTVGSCVIYQEDFSNRNMSGSKGLINLTIGSGSKVFPVAAMALTEVFNNYNSPTLNCQAGGNITAGTTDRRKLIVQFNDGSGWQTVPAMDINSNPYALQADSAHKLGNFPAADYVRTATFPTCVGGEALHFNGASFACVAVGVGSGTVTSVTSANGDITVTNTTTTPQVTLNAGAGANQIVKLNGTSQLPAVSGVNLTALNATNLGSGTVPDARMPALTGDVTMTAGMTATSIANNAVTNTHVAAGAAITRTKLATGSTNHVVVNDGITGALSSIGCSNGELIKWAGGVPTCSNDLAGVGDIINGGNATGATVSVGTTDAQSFALKTNNAAAMTILSNGNVGVGTISPGAPLDVKGAIRMSGSTSGYTGFQPAAAAGSTVWTLPVADGSNNQVLTTNGVGVLSWSTPSAGGITSLNGLSGATQTFANGATGTAPAFSSATTVHTLNIPLASGAGVTSGTISKTDYDSFVAKQAALGFTPLNPANNLSDVANAATSRTNLGLGTAAVLNVGTGNNNIVQLNGTAQLPAVDGSLLTGVVAASIANDTVTDVKVAAGAAIARTKLASGTNNHVLINDGSGVMSSEANLAVSRGGTGVGSFAANQIVGTNGTGTALTSFTCALNQIIKFDVTGNATCGTDVGAGAFVDGGNTFAATATIGTNSNHNLEIETNGTTKMTVLANGNVGVGTTSPAYLLDVGNSGSSIPPFTYSVARLQNTAAATNNNAVEVLFAANRTTGGLTNVAGVSGMITDIGNASYKGALILSTANNAAPAERMRIDQNGNVGVGTTTPAEKLEVNGGVKLGSTANSNAGTIRWDGTNFSGYNGTAWVNFVPNPPGGSVCDTTSNYTTAGTYGYTVPAAFGTITIKIWGAGGGGGSVGSGGSGPGGSGGTTTINSLSLVASGGAGGAIPSGAAAGGAGGTASGGTTNTNGSVGGTSSGSVSGAGGNAPNGGGAGGNSVPSSTPGFAGSSPGGGGSGGSSGNSGGGGGSGAYVEKTFTTATLTPGTYISDLVVGAAGAPGNAINTVYLGGGGGVGRVSITCASAGAPVTNDRGIVFMNGGNYATTTNFIYDSLGNVGIGTTSPAYKLDVAGTTRSVSSIETIVAGGTCSTSYNIDPTTGTMFTLTLNGACAIGVTNLAAGHSFTIRLTQSSTTAPTFTTAYKWPAGTAPTWSATATKYDVIACASFDGTTLMCNGMVDVR